MGSQQTADEKAIIEPLGAQLPGNAGKRTCLITGGILAWLLRVQDRFWLKAIVIIACQCRKGESCSFKAEITAQFKTDAEANDAISFQIPDVSSQSRSISLADSFLSNPKNRIHVLHVPRCCDGRTAKEC